MEQCKNHVDEKAHLSPGGWAISCSQPAAVATLSGQRSQRPSRMRDGQTGTQTDGSLVVLAVAVASRLQLPPPAAPTGADMPPAGGPLRPRDCADTRSAGDAQGPAAVAQAQRRRRGQGLPRPRSRAEQVLPGTARCCKLSVPRNCPHQLWTTRLVFATK